MFALGESIVKLSEIRQVKKTAQRGKSESLFYGIAIAAMELIKAHVPANPDDAQDEVWISYMAELAKVGIITAYTVVEQ